MNLPIHPGSALDVRAVLVERQNSKHCNVNAGMILGQWVRCTTASGAGPARLVRRAPDRRRLALNENSSDEKAVYHLIRALRGSGNDPHGELPALTHRLSQLLAGKRNDETTENKHRLYEPDAPTRQIEAGPN